MPSKAKLEKKKELLTAEIKGKTGNAKSVDEMAEKLGVQARKHDSIPYTSHSIDGFHDDVLFGTLSGLKGGQTSKVTAGEVGVFVATLNSVIEGPKMTDIKATKIQMEQEIGSRSEYEVMNALKEMAEIEDHKSRID